MSPVNATIMKPGLLFISVLLLMCSMSCVTKKDNSMQQKILAQLKAIDSLLRDKEFALSLAKLQDTAYYTGIGKPVPPFLTAAEENAVVSKSKKDEEIASNLAGFYAVECGVGVLCNQTKEKPTSWLEKISTAKADTATILLLNRFANATWKAGQPFKGLDKISRPIFRSASFLPADEIQKDYEQVKAAAAKLFSSLQEVKDSSLDIQMKKIRGLLQSRQYAVEMAAYINAGYTAKEKSDKPLVSAEDSGTLDKPVKEQKIATNLAGFYALESCTNYLASTRNLLPADLLKSIGDNSISNEDKDLYNRFANATWKASQPFRGLERIERETFTPFYFLSKADIDKDWVQIKAAAKKLREALH